MSGNFLRTYEAELQDTVPGIRRKIGIHALLNAMRSRTLQRNYALQAPAVPAVDLDGTVVRRPAAGSPAWNNPIYINFFVPSMFKGTTYRLPAPSFVGGGLEQPGLVFPLRFPRSAGFQNPTNHWYSIVVKRLALQFSQYVRKIRARVQNRHLENYSSGNPLVDLF